MKKPNILFMMSDDHSANAISCYGSILAQVFETPNMDRIANEGVRMDKFFATNSICTPARATIMTGQYGQINGVRCLSDFWDASTPLNLARILQDA
ncbi:MAG: sulfatase-like hydrolase/transferase, partial [Clostridia bacterium]